MDQYLKRAGKKHPADMSKFRADIIEKENEFIIRCELAGYAKDEIDVIATSDKINVTARKSRCENTENENYIHRESICTEKSRTFYIGDIDIDGITADYTDGLLKLTLPKTKHEGGRKIEL